MCKYQYLIKFLLSNAIDDDSDPFTNYNPNILIKNKQFIRFHINRKYKLCNQGIKFNIILSWITMWLQNRNRASNNCIGVESSFGVNSIWFLLNLNPRWWSIEKWAEDKFGSDLIKWFENQQTFFLIWINVGWCMQVLK